MKKLIFPCGASYEGDDNCGLKPGNSRLVVCQSWPGGPKPPTIDGKPAFCMMCHNRSHKNQRVFIDDTDKLGWITLCTGKLSEEAK